MSVKAKPKDTTVKLEESGGITFLRCRFLFWFDLYQILAAGKF